MWGDGQHTQQESILGHQHPQQPRQTTIAHENYRFCCAKSRPEAAHFHFRAFPRKIRLSRRDERRAKATFLFAVRHVACQSLVVQSQSAIPVAAGLTELPAESVFPRSINTTMLVPGSPGNPNRFPARRGSGPRPLIRRLTRTPDQRRPNAWKSSEIRGLPGRPCREHVAIFLPSWIR